MLRLAVFWLWISCSANSTLYCRADGRARQPILHVCPHVGRAVVPGYLANSTSSPSARTGTNVCRIWPAPSSFAVTVLDGLRTDPAICQCPVERGNGSGDTGFKRCVLKRPQQSLELRVILAIREW